MDDSMSESNGHGSIDSDGINIVQVINPFVFRMPEIISFIEQAFTRSMVDDTDALILHLQKVVVADKGALFIGQENMRWLALCVIMRPNIYKDPVVFHFFCDGSVKLRRELMDNSLEWIKSQGYNGFLTSNLNGRESAFKRLFKRAGKADKVGTMYRFEVM